MSLTVIQEYISNHCYQALSGFASLCGVYSLINIHHRIYLFYPNSIPRRRKKSWAYPRTVYSCVAMWVHVLLCFWKIEIKKHRVLFIWKFSLGKGWSGSYSQPWSIPGETFSSCVKGGNVCSRGAFVVNTSNHNGCAATLVTRLQLHVCRCRSLKKPGTIS